MNQRVSVAIPTFNRPESISKRIAESETLSDYISEICISDNSTNCLTEEISEKQASIQTRYQKNMFNIGGGANFLECLKLGTAKYVWLRGDDDPLTEPQAKAISSVLNLNPDIIILSRNARKVEKINSIKEFFSLFHVAQAAGWLSMLVFNYESLNYGIKWGYWGINCGWANVSLVLGILRDKPSPLCIVVPVTLSSQDFREEGRASRKWSVIETCVDNFPSLFSIIPNPSTRSHAFFHWRRSQNFNLLRTYSRAKLGLASKENLTYKTLFNLISWFNPRSSLVALSLVTIWILPNWLLALIFSVFSATLSTSKMKDLELDELINLGTLNRYRFIRNLQKKLSQATPFL